MTITLVHLAIGLLICACVLIAPHASKRTATSASITFSLLAGVSTWIFIAIVMEWI